MKKELRVLVIEDSEDDTFFLVRELERAGFKPRFERVDTADAMTSALDNKSWDVVVCDHSMPQFGSLDALKLVRERQEELPFIVLSGTIGEEEAVNMMKAGANDYVMKDKLARLVPAIEREMREAKVRRAKRAAEEALRQNRRELEDFFDHAPLGLHWVGPDGTILRANDTELEMLGYSPNEYVGHNITEFHEDPSVAGDILRRLNLGETFVDCESRLRCKDGSLKDVVINSNALWENGKLIHSRSSTRDVTAEKQAQTDQAYLAAIVESSEDAVIGKTLDGIILTWNSAAERMYGYTAAEVKGRSASILIPSSRPEEWPEIYDKLREGERLERFETIRVTKSGVSLNVSLTLSPIKNAAGQIIGISGIERDITALKREEAERLKLIQELTDALTKIKTLKGLLPICSSCKKIRDDRGYWQKVESYLSDHTDAEFTHGICPDCVRRLYPNYEGDKPQG